MADYGDLYSRIIAWVKILLPLAALVLLSSLFLVARRPDADGALPFSEVALEELARDQGILSAHYTGVTDDGRSLSVRAQRALPRAGNRRVLDAQTVLAELSTAEGDAIRLLAPAARIDTEAGVADLSGGVTVETPDGYRVQTEALRAALERTELDSLGPARLTGPGLTIDARQLSVRSDPRNADSVIVVFKGGVHLIYDPSTIPE